MKTPPERGIEETHHQELQKARHDWLREEIVKLKGMKGMRSGNKNSMYYQSGHSSALQTIIDRYQSELDQPTIS